MIFRIYLELEEIRFNKYRWLWVRRKWSKIGFNVGVVGICMGIYKGRI